MQDPQSLHKYLYGHGDPITMSDPNGMFSLGGMIASIGISMGNVATELVTGALIVTTLETGGRAGFDARAGGLMLIAQGEFELGFTLYNLGNRIIGLVFNVIETIDTAIGLGQIAGAMVWGGIALARNAPDIADSLIGRSQSLFRKFGDSPTWSQAGRSCVVGRPCGSALPWRVCFTPDTPVATESGTIPIGAFEAGDKLLSFDFTDGEWHSRTVLERHDSIYDGPIVTAETEGGTIQTTAYHPFLVVAGRELHERAVPRELDEGEDEGRTLSGRWVNSHELGTGKSARNRFDES